MSRFVEGEDRRQPTLLPSGLDDYIGDDNPARVIDAFVDELGLGALGFVVAPAATGRPACHLATLLKLYVYGYLNRVPSSRGLEREAGRGCGSLTRLAGSENLGEVVDSPYQVLLLGPAGPRRAALHASVSQKLRDLGLPQDASPPVVMGS